MVDRSKIEEPVAAELARFNEEFETSLRSGTNRLQSAIEHILNATGKHVRPLLVLLSAKACGGVTDNSINSAVFLELLHTATLIHDDVVDMTLQRRGEPSLNAIFDNRVAVLTGDYILSTALVRSIRTGDLRIVAIISDLGRDLSEGEIKQMETADENIFDEECYLQVIYKKTATLLSACTSIGAISSGCNEHLIERMRLFGENIGYAFQIRDDIFDYFNVESKIGKPTGNDIREGKVTLPLLYALNKGGDEADELTDVIRKRNFTDENIARLICYAKQKGGIEYAERKMTEYRDKALEALKGIPDSPACTALADLADYIILRDK